jgi:hypothetical protein
MCDVLLSFDTVDNGNLIVYCCQAIFVSPDLPFKIVMNTCYVSGLVEDNGIRCLPNNLHAPYMYHNILP